MTRTIFLLLVCSALLPSQSRFDVVEATIPEMRAAMEQKRITSRELVVLSLTRIALYDAKYYYQLWRPVTAIRQTDPTWTPLAVTALDPSYPSAHGVISGDGATVLAAFFGNQDQVRVTSDVLPGVVRTFASYNDVATEAGLSRIYAGQHTRIEIEVGSELGHNVAQFVLPHFSVHAGGTGGY